jgi:hypothetical protein
MGPRRCDDLGEALSTERLALRAPICSMSPSVSGERIVGREIVATSKERHVARQAPITYPGLVAPD